MMTGHDGDAGPGAVGLASADRAWLHALPKVELHVHLEGSMSVATVRELTERHGVDPTPIWSDGFPEAFSFGGFPSFAAQYFYGLSLLRSAEDLATITDDLAATLAEQHVRYAEITTTAYAHFLDKDDRPGMSWGEYREGLDEGQRRARARGVELGWVVDIPRDLEMPDQTVTIEYLESSETPAGLVAIGLGGYEVGFPAAPYAPHFARAAALGLPAVPHAGETEGADSVRQAVEQLGAVRIGHGVRCLEDPAVVELLREREIMLEVCPTSNDLLQVIERIGDHPLPELIDAGLRVCLNTDDPGWFATDLVHELEVATEYLGVTLDQHRAMQLDAVDASFMPAESAAACRQAITDH
jgi:aminodeoxyfutalosine deaminase